MRLWLLDEIKAVEDGLKGLIRVMVERADKEVDILMPGYTHLQVTLRSSNPKWSLWHPTTAWTANPVVSSLTLACPLFPLWSWTTSTARSSSLSLAPRKWRPCRKSICCRPWLVGERTWVSICRRKQHVGCGWSWLYRRVLDVGELDDDSHESSGRGSDCLLYSRIRICDFEWCV